jgi:RNA polymerase sigma-70 factor (ECF subfamily)
MTIPASDGELVTRLLAGDLEALGVLYQRHRTSVYRTALAVTRDPSAAEDILQDCFLRLHRYAHRIDTTRPLKPWLGRVTVNLAYTWARSGKRWQTPQVGNLEWIAGPDSQCPEWKAEMNDLQSKVVDAVSSLSLNQCIVIALHYLNSFSLKEIAQVLNCPVGTVKSRLYYGRENLNRNMKAGSTVTPEMLHVFA